MISPDTGSRWKVSGKQHRDGGDRPDAGEHADQRSDHRADEREPEVRRRQRNAEADREVVEELHRYHSGQTGMVSPSPAMNIAHDNAISTRAASAVSSGRSARVAKAPTPASSTIATTSPSRSMLSANSHQRCRHRDDRAPGRRLRWHRARRLAPALDHDQRAESEQRPAQEPRHVAGAHPQRRADRIVARYPKAERGHRHEQQPGQHVVAPEHLQDGRLAGLFAGVAHRVLDALRALSCAVIARVRRSGSPAAADRTRIRRRRRSCWSPVL